MCEIIRTMLALSGTFFDMFTTIMFYKACLGSKNIRANKIIFYLAFVLLFAVSMALSQFSLDGLINIIMSVILYFILTLLYNSKWTSRIFTALSYLVIGMISELISYGIVAATMKNTSYEDLQFYSLMLSKIITFIITVAVTLIVKKNTQIVRFKDYLCFIITPLISIATVILISFESDTGEPNATLGVCMAAAG